MPDSFCPSCGDTARPGARFCPSCGRAVGSGAGSLQAPAPPPGGGAWPFPAPRRPRPDARLIVQGAVLTLLAVATGAVGVHSVLLMGADRELCAEAADRLVKAGAMGEAAASMRSTMRDLLLTTDLAENQRHKKDFDDSKEALRRAAAELMGLAGIDPVDISYADAVSSSMDRYFVFADEAVRLAMENRNAEAYRYMRTAALPANNKFREDLAAMKAFMRDLVRAQTERSEAASRASVRALATCLAAAAALGLMTSFLPIAAKR